MTQWAYNEADLIRALGRIPVPLRVAFAAACAERLFPAYGAFWERAGRGDRAALAAILQDIWRDLLGDKMAVGHVRAKLSRCMALIPGEGDTPWVDEQAYADDAAAAIAYALRTLESGEPQEAAWAARRAYEALDHHVVHRLGVEGEEQLLAHPLVQAELARQRRDLDELLSARQDPAVLVVRLRDRARAEAPTLFGSASQTPNPQGSWGRS
jgi:uncharacterized protein YjaG (DUF416 family)